MGDIVPDRHMRSAKASSSRRCSDVMKSQPNPVRWYFETNFTMSSLQVSKSWGVSA